MTTQMNLQEWWKFPLRVARGHGAFQLEEATGRAICAGMTSHDAAILLHIVSEFVKPKTVLETKP